MIQIKNIPNIEENLLLHIEQAKERGDHIFEYIDKYGKLIRLKISDRPVNEWCPEE